METEPIEQLIGAANLPSPLAALAHATGDGSGDSPVVAVIGAGMSGILAAHRLTQAGIDCVVLDRNDDVGGTWLENTYPGCRVDVFNHVYCYSGEQRPDWPEYHSSQGVLLDYFRDCARRWGIRDRIRFGVRASRSPGTTRPAAGGSGSAPPPAKARRSRPARWCRPWAS